MPKKISTVLFDLDGTLLDTAPDLAGALNTVLTHHRKPPLDFEKIRPLASTGSRGLLGLGFQIDEYHPDFQRLRHQFLHAYHERIAQETTIFPGVVELISQIEEQQLRWGIVTNKPAHLAQLLLKNFESLMGHVCMIGGDTVAKCKPDPASLLHACEVIGCSTQECVYIGDAERDIMAAKRANMSSIAALYGYIGNHEKPSSWNADHYIQHPQEILDWLQKQPRL